MENKLAFGSKTKGRLLELFSGSKSVSKCAKTLGYTSLSVDKFIESDLQIGIEKLTRETIIAAVMWALFYYLR